MLKGILSIGKLLLGGITAVSGASAVKQIAEAQEAKFANSANTNVATIINLAKWVGIGSILVYGFKNLKK